MNTCVYISCIIKAPPASSIRVDDNYAQVASDSANYEIMSGRKLFYAVRNNTYLGLSKLDRVKIVSTVSSHYRLIPVEVQCRDCPGCDHGGVTGVH